MMKVLDSIWCCLSFSVAIFLSNFIRYSGELATASLSEIAITLHFDVLRMALLKTHGPASATSNIYFLCVRVQLSHFSQSSGTEELEPPLDYALT